MLVFVVVLAFLELHVSGVGIISRFCVGQLV
jgi:hypothetical protein